MIYGNSNGWICVCLPNLGYGGGVGGSSHYCKKVEIHWALVARRKQDKHSHSIRVWLFFPSYTKDTLTKATFLIVRALILHSKLIKGNFLVWLVFPTVWWGHEAQCVAALLRCWLCTLPEYGMKFLPWTNMLTLSVPPRIRNIWLKIRF